MYNQVEITLKPVHSEKPIYFYAHHQIIEAIEKLPKQRLPSRQQVTTKAVKNRLKIQAGQTTREYLLH